MAGAMREEGLVGNVQSKVAAFARPTAMSLKTGNGLKLPLLVSKQGIGPRWLRFRGKSCKRNCRAATVCGRTSEAGPFVYTDSAHIRQQETAPYTGASGQPGSCQR